MTRRFLTLALALLTSGLSIHAFADDVKQSPANPDLQAADQSYKAGKFVEAAEKYQTLVQTDPKLVPAQAGLIHSLLREQKIDEASAAAASALALQANSAVLLTAMGDVQFRLGKMPEAEKSYVDALNIDHKQVRAYLGRARIYRAYSLYRHAYDQLAAAYQIAPNDPEVQRLWFRQLSRRDRIAAIEVYLASPHPEDDAEETEHLQHYLEFLKATVDKPPHACKLVSKVEQTETKLEMLLTDPRHMRGFGLAVKLNDYNGHLLLDTGASGIIVGRKVAEKAGLTPISEIAYGGIGNKGMQKGHLEVADRIRIGELEFHDCVVEVSDKASLADEDGLIGADVFSSYLIDLDFPDEKLRLSPLPKRPDETVAPTALSSEGEEQADSQEKSSEAHGDSPTPHEADAAQSANAPTTRRIPKDRYVAPEMANWTSVFRFGHELLIPTFVNDSSAMLFLIDTGAFASVLSTRAAREVTQVSADSRLQVKGLSGSVDKVYTGDKATLYFGHLHQKNQDIVTFDLSNISKHTGTEVSGILGFRLLRVLRTKLDYRDGLVDFVYDASRWH